jgi:hypothetical protein
MFSEYNIDKPSRHSSFHRYGHGRQDVNTLTLMNASHRLSNAVWCVQAQNPLQLPKDLFQSHNEHLKHNFSITHNLDDQHRIDYLFGFADSTALIRGIPSLDTNPAVSSSGLYQK